MLVLMLKVVRHLKGLVFSCDAPSLYGSFPVVFLLVYVPVP